MDTVNNNNNEFVRQVAEQKYEFGFTTDVHTDIIDVGLNEDVVRLISAKKGEPEWLLDFRLKAFNYWKTQEQPTWGHVHVPDIDYQAISYYADPMAKKKDEGKKEIDPELMKTFDKLGIPLEERLALSGQTAVDAIMDSVSVKTTYKEKLAEKGIIFCSIGDAVKQHPDLCVSIWAVLCRTVTISSPRLTAPFSATARSCTYPRACAVRWSSARISA